ncbi:MAG: hypothetical protein ACLTKI_04145 [Lachnospiraceae bacterium]
MATLFRTYNELKQVRNIAVMALFAALSIVLGSCVIIANNYRIGFSTISNAMVIICLDRWQAGFWRGIGYFKVY